MRLWGKDSPPPGPPPQGGIATVPPKLAKKKPEMLMYNMSTPLSELFAALPVVAPRPSLFKGSKGWRSPLGGQKGGESIDQIHHSELDQHIQAPLSGWGAGG